MTLAAHQQHSPLVNLDQLLCEFNSFDVDNLFEGLDQPCSESRTSLPSSHVAPSSPTPTHRSSSSSSSATTTIHNHVLPSTASTSSCSNSSSISATPFTGVVRREKLHPPRTDAHRLSKANLEDSGDLELDAILGELCALGSQFDQELKDRPAEPHPSSSNTGGARRMPCTANRSSQQGDSKAKFDCGDGEQPNPAMSRTDSPDNDSAFSDCVSVLSSESSASSGASNAHRQQQLQLANQVDNAAQLKAEKIKLALEKIKEANVKKLFLKAFSRDGSSKSLLVDEKMTVARVTRLLADKNHVTMDPKWTIVEHLPDLYMERIYEDDEMLVENLLLWARDSQNKLYFLDRPDKYMLFWQPEQFLNASQSTPAEPLLDDEAKNNLIEEFFSSGSVPEVEGPLFLKSEGKKMWKKFYFILRASGLYYCPKGKSSRSSKDLVCLVTFDGSQVYQGVGWRKKHKSPTDWGFAIKPVALQSKSSKHIKYLCTDDAASMHRWITAIRIAKCGRRLLTNYRALIEDLAQEDIDLLASSRSFSLASVAAPSSQATTPSSESRSLDSCLASSVATSADDSDRDDDCDSDGATPVNTLDRQHAWCRNNDLSVAATHNASVYNTLASTTSTSSSSSSGCMSHRSNASTPSTEHGFESEFSQQGTIKRKPAAPKIPLTNTTRQMLHDREFECGDNAGVIGNSSGASLITALRQSLRRSINDESSSSLKRRNSSSSTLPRGFSSAKHSVEERNSHSTLPSMPAPSYQSAEIDGLPLPLPLPDVDPVDPSFLPPPPPELLASTLSLASSLPPPPDELSPPNPDEMTCSMISLPPPPPPLTLPLANLELRLASPPTLPHASMKPKSPPPPPVAPKPRRISDSSSHSPPSPLSPPVGVMKNKLPVQPPPKPKKKISFKEDVQNIPPCIYSPSPSPPTPSSPSKPPPPPRSDSTRLSNSPQSLSNPANKLTPPRTFLCSLQKVMQRKWQVAEKCKDFDQNPHEVLGFRDSLPPTETERNVGLWIQEHYGNIYDHLGNNPNNQNGCSDSDSLPSPPLPSPPPVSPPLSSPSVQSQRPLSDVPCSGSSIASSNRLSQGSVGKKRPPPPPPKRSDSTHLSSIH
ncbi:abnormal cell migration protein 10 isoform X2 [Hyalella azteca]|uniref:Abnormal cell migration protein 10 isoform X2 n=1 Tax=Hyalella azteca TaxID=294128 RepID=A0A8B7NDD8_HYAAZ|nr:abnormal cell migration protein 10 isoform X2 [Hyalella azteca]